MNRCIYCNEDRGEDPVNHYFCSEECSEKWDIKNDFETYSDDEVVCPYCGYIHLDLWDGDAYVDANGDIFECDSCGREFILTADRKITFTATPTEEMVDRIYDGDEQLEL